MCDFSAQSEWNVVNYKCGSIWGCKDRADNIFANNVSLKGEHWKLLTTFLFETFVKKNVKKNVKKRSSHKQQSWCDVKDI